MTQKVLSILFICLVALVPLMGWAQSDRRLDNGRRVRWYQPQVTFVVDHSFVHDPYVPDTLGLMRAVVDTWRAGSTSVPVFHVQSGALGEPGYSTDSQDNASGIAIYYRDFPRDLPSKVLALTLLTNDRVTGEIVDADILINAEGNTFRVITGSLLGRADDVNDFQNVITHEFGHALGLLEDPWHADATMYPSSRPGEVHKRDLARSDLSSISRAYKDEMARGPSERSLDPLYLAALAVFSLAALLHLYGRISRRKRILPGIVVALTLLIAGLPTPRGAEEGFVVSSRSFWSGRTIFTAATVQTSHGLERVERPGGRIGSYEQRVLDIPSGHELQVGRRVSVQN